MKKYNLGISALLIAAGVFLLKTSGGYGTAVSGTAMGAGAWPSILSILLILLAVVLAAETGVQYIRERKQGKKKEEEKEKKVIDFTGRGMIRVYLILGILALFYVLLRFFGFWIAAALAIPAITCLMGERKWWKLLLLTAGILLFVFLVFDLLLGLTLPVGLLFR